MFLGQYSHVSCSWVAEKRVVSHFMHAVAYRKLCVPGGQRPEHVSCDSPGDDPPAEWSIASSPPALALHPSGVPMEVVVAKRPLLSSRSPSSQAFGPSFPYGATAR